MRETSAILAVLWDMDGTLIDSETYWMAAERQLAEDYLGSWSGDLGKRLVGLNLFDAAKILRQEFAIADLNDQQIIDRMTAIVTSKLAESIPWRPGVVELMGELDSRGIRNAVVTGSMGRMARLVASSMPSGRFEVVIAGDDVEHGKPHPEPYLRALEALQLRADQCIAIEDSPTGMASAKSAGLRVLGVTNLVPLSEIGAARVISTLERVTLKDLESLW